MVMSCTVSVTGERFDEIISRYLQVDSRENRGAPANVGSYHCRSKHVGIRIGCQNLSSLRYWSAEVESTATVVVAANHSRFWE